MSLVWLQTELDSTQSYYHYLSEATDKVNNIMITLMWEPIINRFFCKFKWLLTNPQYSISEHLGNGNMLTKTTSLKNRKLALSKNEKWHYTTKSHQKWTHEKFFKAQLRLKSDVRPHNQLILHLPHLSKLTVLAVLYLKFQNIIQSQYGENTEWQT